MFFLWSDKYSVGNEELDNQHKKIFDLINELNNIISEGSGEKKIAQILFDMSKYVEFHFRAEEDMLRSIGYIDLMEQLDEHEVFIMKIIEFMEQYNISPSNVNIIELNNYLVSWISNHVLISDMKYKEYMINK